eukprot:snap_masked-scaffold_2-processed-gene-8.2-mRNA-1 protein AED:1.00 eAED:1.00 QI:0/0/0/0/1/1/3/0/70
MGLISFLHDPLTVVEQEIFIVLKIMFLQQLLVEHWQKVFGHLDRVYLRNLNYLLVLLSCHSEYKCCFQLV